MIRFCKKCQAETERKANNDCKPCAKVRAAIWAAKNSDQLKARCAAWRIANLDREKANNLAWYAANIERARATRRDYQAANADQLKVKKAEYYVANADSIKEKTGARYAANPKQFNAASAVWRKANPERKKAIDAAWHKANPEANRINGQNRRARKRANGGTLSKGLAAKLFKLQKGKCPCCKQPLGDKFHLDHIVPIAKGGSNTDDNIQLLRSRCNNQKHARDSIDFMQSRGFLL